MRSPDFEDTEDADLFTEESYHDRKEVRCKHCRERDLFWAERHQQWVLVDGEGRLHQCKTGTRAADVNEFDPVE